MGCDIHVYFESQDSDGNWNRVRPETEEKFERGRTEGMSPEEWDGIVRAHFDSPLYIPRDYDLFAILANVRNGRGFAGVRTGSGFEPISEPRGVPQGISSDVFDELCCDADSSDPFDVSRMRKWVADGYSKIVTEDPLRVTDPDYHSVSYYTAQELLDYDGWDKKTTSAGVVSQTAYAKWNPDTDKFPDEMLTLVAGAFVEYVSEEELQRRIAEGLPSYSEEAAAYYKENDLAIPQNLCTYFVEVEFEVSYRDCCRYFVDKFLPALKSWADEIVGGDYSRLRMVFWFDN